MSRVYSIIAIRAGQKPASSLHNYLIAASNLALTSFQLTTFQKFST